MNEETIKEIKASKEAINDILKKYIGTANKKQSIIKSITEFLKKFQKIRRIPENDYSKYMYSVTTKNGEHRVIGLYVFNSNYIQSQKYFKAIEEFWMSEDPPDTKLFVRIHEHTQFANICGFLIFEHCQYSLEKFLQDHNDDDGFSIENRPLILKLILSIFEALNIIHQKNFIHRNIRPSKLFLNDGNLKLIPSLHFRKLKDEMSESQGTGKIPYKAPEMLDGSFYDRSVDIFAAGIVAWQILNTKSKPFVSYVTKEQFTDEIREMSYNFKNTRDPIYKIIGSCIDVDPSSRPSAISVVEIIKALIPQDPPITKDQSPFEEPDFSFNEFVEYIL